MGAAGTDKATWGSERRLTLLYRRLTQAKAITSTGLPMNLPNIPFALEAGLTADSPSKAET